VAKGATCKARSVTHERHTAVDGGNYNSRNYNSRNIDG
jgi:hypothetical protein